MAPHNLTLSVIGASLLWVGWFGFNAGSALTAGTGAGFALLVTQLATAVAALAWTFAEWMQRGKPQRSGHRLRCGRRAGRDHAGLRLRRRRRCDRHRSCGRTGLLLGLDRPQAQAGIRRFAGRLRHSRRRWNRRRAADWRLRDPVRHRRRGRGRLGRRQFRPDTAADLRHCCDDRVDRRPDRRHPRHCQGDHRIACERRDRARQPRP